MKSTDLRCDVCTKSKKIFDSDEDNSADHSPQNDELLMITNAQQSVVVAKCFDCNFYLCSSCLLDHHLISAYAAHQIFTLNSKLNNHTALQRSSNFQVSNMSQLQQQYTNLEDHLLIKRKPTQPQQNQQQQQQMINSRIVQIESEIQKSYNFYVQMLKERRDYLINELNTIVQYAIQNHQQNLNKQLKLKLEIEQKRQSLEIAEAVASAIAASNTESSTNTPTLSSDSTHHDNNNNKISASLIELNNLAAANYQMLYQLKNNNPLTSIEFVSNYSTIQTSIRNTFGYIRINNQFNNNGGGNNGGNNLPIYDYLLKSSQQQNELSVMCDLDSSSSGVGSNPLSYNSDYLNTLSNGSAKSGNLTIQPNLGSFVNKLSQKTNEAPLSSSSSSSSSNSTTSGVALYASLMKNEFNSSPLMEWSNPIGGESAKSSSWSSIVNNLNKEDDYSSDSPNISEQKQSQISVTCKPTLSNSTSQSSYTSSSSFKNFGSTNNNAIDDCSPSSSSSSAASEHNYDLNNTTLTTVIKATNVSSNLAITNSGRPQLKRSKMIYHCKFGEFGVNDAQFTEPSGVTVNGDNDIIVADTNSHRIQIFDKEGRFKFKFGECGKRDGQLLYPNRVSVVKATGDIVVTERSPTHQIQIYNKYGQFMRKFGANILQHPRGVCVDAKGRIIVVECKVMRVLIFDLMGNVLQKFNCSKYLEFPNGVCCSNSGDREEIYISDNRAHCIKVFDYNGNFIRQIGGEGITNYPIGVGINSNNEILVADNHNNFNLTVFTQDGQLINALESKVKHAQCFDVGLMDDGSIVLASKDYRIYVYKYVNNNLTLSSQCGVNPFGDLNLNEGNEFLLGGLNNDALNLNGEETTNNIYGLFSPPGHFNPILSSNLMGNSLAKSHSSDNLIDSMPIFNSLLL